MHNVICVLLLMFSRMKYSIICMKYDCFFRVNQNKVDPLILYGLIISTCLIHLSDIFKDLVQIPVKTPENTSGGNHFTIICTQLKVPTHLYCFWG